MSPFTRNSLFLTALAIGIAGAAMLGLLSPTVAVLAAIGFLTAMTAVSTIWRAGTPAPPMRQLLYDMDPHEEHSGRRGR